MGIFISVPRDCLERYTSLYLGEKDMSILGEAYGLVDPHVVIYNAVEKGNPRFVIHLGVLQLRYRTMLERNGVLSHVVLSMWATENGYFTTLKWMNVYGVLDISNVCGKAAQCGHFEILKWGMTLGFPRDTWTTAWAAQANRLDILQWLRIQGCEWDAWTLNFAAQRGSMPIVKWARANGCPIDHWACSYAAYESHYDIVEWLIRTATPHERERWFRALEQNPPEGWWNGHVQVLTWAYTHAYISYSGRGSNDTLYILPLPATVAAPEKSAQHSPMPAPATATKSKGI